jgi:hypothetical protein
MKQYYQINGLRVKRGNNKLGTDTLILNMGPARTCPAQKFCKVRKDCYALRDEELYPGVEPYRQSQAQYWLNTGAWDIIRDFDLLFEKYSELTEIKYLRFNESGDFWSQECVQKLETIARHLKLSYDITTYGYTAREDLKFNLVSFFSVKGSSNDSGNNGRTEVINSANELRDLGEGWTLCPADCSQCDLCKVPDKLNIAFFNHVSKVSRAKRVQYSLF